MVTTLPLFSFPSSKNGTSKRVGLTLTEEVGRKRRQDFLLWGLVTRLVHREKNKLDFKKLILSYFKYTALITKMGRL